MPSEQGINRGRVDSALDWVLARSRPITGIWALLLGLALILLVASLDVFVGPNVEFSVLYVIPVMVVAWCGGRQLGLLMAVIAATSWGAAQALADPASIPLWAMTIMLLTRVGALALIALAMYAVREATERYSQLAELDPLTLILNRRALFERLNAEIARCERHPQPLTVLYFDVDEFKAVNDLKGHEHGDRLLNELAKAMTSTLRPEDLCARVGGDEFVGVLPQTDAAGARASATRLLENLNRVAARYESAVSLGVVTYLSPPTSNGSAVSFADQEMYRAKRAGPGRVEFAVRV